MKAEEIMTKQVFDVMESDDIYQAFSKFHQHRIHQLLVVNVESKLCGMVSDRDILRLWAEIANSDRAFPQVGTIMKRDVLTCAPDDTVADVARCMLEMRIHAVPVVDNKRRPLGIITNTDLLRFGLKNFNFMSRYQALPAMI